MQDIFQTEIGIRLDNYMDMIVHHDIGVEPVTSTIKMTEA